MGWMEGLIFGVRTIYTAGANAIQDAAVNFAAPISPAWDDENEWINVGIDPVSSSSHGAVVATTGAAKVLVAGASAASWAKLVNANVDAAAAIDGTKINPNFGAQSVVTTGDIEGDNVTALVACSGETLSCTTTLTIGSYAKFGPGPNVETLAASKILTTADRQSQALDPTGAGYTVRLPAVSAGLAFWIKNTSGSTPLVVERPDTTTLKSLGGDAGGFFHCTSSAWVYMG